MSGRTTPDTDASLDDAVAPTEVGARPRRDGFSSRPTAPVIPTARPNMPTTPPPQRPTQPPPNTGGQPLPNVTPPQPDPTPTPTPTAAPIPTPTATRTGGGLRGLQRRGADRKLAPDKALWGVRLSKVLNLPIPSSQRRVADEGLATAGQIAASTTHSPQDKADASVQEAALKLAGDPPWTAEAAMRATAAKVQLDLLSIPTADRKLVPNGDQSVNKTFWVENAADDGSKTKSFLCKPASKPGSVMPGGGPAGGEVIREALAGRAAQFFLTQGVDIGMPETHVVKLRPELIGGATGATGDVTCSVQQFGKSVGPLGTQSRADIAKIDGKKVASLAVFDAMTLANDRHSGNVLMGTDGSLIPIDHGENFTEVSSPNAAARLKVTLAGTANGLLKIPSAHDPMPPEIAKSVGAFNPGAFAETLRDDRDAIAGEHGDMSGLISDEAILSAARAAEFTKRGAKMKPPLSVAAIQVALGTHVAELVDPKLDYGVFGQNADRILTAVAKQQGAIKEVCLTSDTDYEVLCQEVEKLGWYTQRRGEATDDKLIADPMTMLAILSGKIRKPAKQGPVVYPPELQPPEGVLPKDLPDDIKQQRKDVREDQEKTYKAGVDVIMDGLATARDTVGDGEAANVMVNVRKQATDFLLTIIPALKRAPMRVRRAKLDAQPQSPALVTAYRDLSDELNDMALAEQKRRFTKIEQASALDKFFEFEEFNGNVIPGSYKDAFQNLTAGNTVKAEPDLVKLENTDFDDKKLLEKLHEKFVAISSRKPIAADDARLVSFLDALKNRDPRAGIGYYGALRKYFA